jgi:hypothetical protein
LLRQLVAFQKRFPLLDPPLAEIGPEFDRNNSSADALQLGCQADQDAKNSTGYRYAAIVFFRDNEET